MNKIKIIFSIFESSLAIERSRDQKLMSEDDLLWCYGGSLTILDTTEMKKVFELGEVCLIGLLFDLISNSMEIKRDGKLQIIPDREGTYCLNLSLKNGNMNLRNEWSNDFFVADRAVFFEALDEYAFELESLLSNSIGDLAQNTSYRTLFQILHGQLNELKSWPG